MKYSIILLFAVMLASCGKEETTNESDCQSVQYGEVFSIQVGDEVCFPDGYGFTVEVFEDQFCPCDMLCFFHGELSVLVETVNPVNDKSLVRFGTSGYTHASEIFENATISNLDYTYKEDQTLPDCGNTFDQKEVTVQITIDKI